MQGRPSTTIKIQDTEWECLLDTSANINVMDQKVLDELVNVRIEKTQEKLRCTNDSKLEVIWQSNSTNKHKKRNKRNFIYNFGKHKSDHYRWNRSSKEIWD